MECPLPVTLESRATQSRGPLCPNQLTSSAWRDTSVIPLFDYLVGAGEQSRRHGEAEGFRAACRRRGVSSVAW
jgi:hypothetical protein